VFFALLFHCASLDGITFSSHSPSKPPVQFSGSTIIVSDDLGTIINEAGDNIINGNIYEFSGGGQAYMVVNGGTLTLNGPIGLSTSSRPFEFGGAGNGFVYSAITSTGIAVRKVDSGTWTFYNTYSHTNVTTVEGGTMAFGSSATMAKTLSFNVFSNATWDVSQEGTYYLSSGTINQMLLGGGAINGSIGCTGPATIAPGSNNVPGTLTFSNNLSLNSSSTVLFDLGTATTPGGGTNSFINVMGNLDSESANIQINPIAPLTSPGTYLVMNYGSESSLFNSTVTAPGTRYNCTLNDNGVGQISLSVSGGPANLVWSGGSDGGLWDINTTANWNNGTQTFYNVDNVQFDDSASVTSVLLNTTVQPGSVLFTNSTKNYFLYGSGKITGNTGLTKSGSGVLAIANNAGHTFTGPVTINGGTLMVSNVALNGTAWALGTGSNIIMNGGTLQYCGAKPAIGGFNRFFTLGANGGTILSTNGTFFIPNVISGAGSLTKTGAVQIILGDILASALTNANNSYTGNTYVAQGELQIRNAHALGYGKAVVSSNCDLSVGGSASYGTITNEIDLNGGDGNQNAGSLQVNDGGTAATFSGIVDLLNNSSVGTVSNGNTVTFVISGPVIGSGALKKLGTNIVTLTSANDSYAGGTMIFSGTLQLGNGSTCGTLGSGAATNNSILAFDHSDNVTINPAISGSGKLTHTGGGTLTLGGISSYTGTTAISGGTVLVNGALGATTVTVSNTATLGGYGAIGGPVTVQTGGTLALGASIGALTINNTLTLSGTNIMKVSHLSAATNDVIQSVTTLTFGGTLNIVTNGTLQSGDTFHLFNAGSYAGAFAVTNLPVLTGGLSWDTSNLGSGILKVAGGNPPPPQFVQAPLMLNDGNFQLKFAGTSGNYRLWTTTNLAFSPITSTWTQLTSGTFSGGSVTFKDSNATNYPRRFYSITIP
jgi:autotransporter-associated beta strand protein